MHASPVVNASRKQPDDQARGLGEEKKLISMLQTSHPAVRVALFSGRNFIFFPDLKLILK